MRAVWRLAAGREAEPTAAIIDSRTLRSTPESGPRAGYDGAKRKKGSKLHLAVDTLGHLLALHVTPADVGDRAEVARLAQAIQEATNESVTLAYVDQGYTGENTAKPPRRTASRSRSSNCPRPSAASCCSRDDGSSNARSPGPRAAEDWSRITSDTLQPSPASTSSLSFVSCSRTPLYSPQVHNTL